jgi:hypothetical protein
MKRWMVVIALLIVTACTRKQESETLVAPLPAPVVPETVVVPPPAPAVPDVDDIHFSIEDASNYFNIIFGNLSFRLPYGYDFMYYNGIDDFYEHVIRDNNSMGLSITIFKINNFPDGPGFYSPSRFIELAEYIAGRRSRLDSFGSKRPYRLRSFNNINAAETLTLGEYSFDDIQFSRRITFFDDKYGYFLGFSDRNNDIDKILPRELPEYFLVSEYGSYYWSDEALEEINYKFSNNEVLPEYLQEMIEKGDIIFQTMYLK